MATEVSVKAASTGTVLYYSTYSAARSTASSGDVIQIWADLDEQIILKDGVDIWIAPGRILDMTGASPTIIDNGVKCRCNIFGSGILKNSYSGGTKQECVKISDDESEIYIECDYLVGLGGTAANTWNAPTVSVTNAARFSLVCNQIYSYRNSVVIISNCDNFYIKSKSVISGIESNTNVGPAVLYLNGSGSIYLDELVCNGYGSCLEQTGGIINGKILKIKTLNNGTAAHPAILVDNVSGDQLLNLNFDEIENLNSTDGDAVTIAEGSAILTGRRIYSSKGLSLDLGANANIRCSEIISDVQGVNIHNTDPERIIIDADIIKGGIGNNGAVYAVNSANFTLRNATVTCTNTSSSSTAIYLNPGGGNLVVEFINLIAVTGNTTWGNSVYCIPGVNDTNINNYTLFVNKVVDGATVIIGTGANHKYIIDLLVA